MKMSCVVSVWYGTPISILMKSSCVVDFTVRVHTLYTNLMKSSCVVFLVLHSRSDFTQVHRRAILLEMMTAKRRNQTTTMLSFVLSYLFLIHCYE